MHRYPCIHKGFSWDMKHVLKLMHLSDGFARGLFMVLETCVKSQVDVIHYCSNYQ